MIKRLLLALLLLAPAPAGAQTWLSRVQTMACGGSQFARGLAVTGAWTCAQPAFSDLTGTIAPSQLVAPGAATFGAVKSSSAPANQFATGLSTSGVLTYAQPSFANLSGAATAAQLPGVIVTTTQTGTAYTLQATDCGTEIQMSNASAIVVTLPAALPTTCVVSIMQAGVGNVSFTQAATSTTPANSHGYTMTYGQFALVTLSNNVGGVASAWAMRGDAQ